MNIFHAIILGVIQGIGEFLPISSSAHLILIPFEKDKTIQLIMTIRHSEAKCFQCAEWVESS